MKLPKVRNPLRNKMKASDFTEEEMVFFEKHKDDIQGIVGLLRGSPALVTFQDQARYDSNTDGEEIEEILSQLLFSVGFINGYALAKEEVGGDWTQMWMKEREKNESPEQQKKNVIARLKGRK